MAIDNTFELLKMVDDRDVRNWKGVPQARKGTVRIELTVTSREFNSKMVRPNRQSSSMLKFMHLRHQGGKLLRRIAMKTLV